MSHTDINNKMREILNYKFNIDEEVNLYNASLSNDLGLDRWDVNLLLYYVEHSFDVNLKPGLEMEISSMNQLVSQISNEIMTRKVSANN